MPENVVILSKRAFLPSEPIEMHIVSKKTISIFIAPIKMSNEPLVWTLIKTAMPDEIITLSIKLEPGYYVVGAYGHHKPEPCTVLKITDSSLGFLQASSLFATAGLASFLCFIKITLFSKNNR